MRGAAVMPLCLLVGALYLWHAASQFRGGVGRYEVLGPAFFPKLLLAGLIAVSALQILTLAARAWRTAEAGGARPIPIHWRDLALALAVTAAYTASLGTAGFLVATPLFQVLLLGLVFRVTDWRLLLGVPVALTTLFALIFIGLMGVPLPRGRGPFAEMSRLVY